MKNILKFHLFDLPLFVNIMMILFYNDDINGYDGDFDKWFELKKFSFTWSIR